MRQYAGVVKLVDALGLKPSVQCPVLGVRVRIPFPVPATIKYGARAIIPTKTVLGI